MPSPSLCVWIYGLFVFTGDAGAISSDGTKILRIERHEKVHFSVLKFRNITHSVSLKFLGKYDLTRYLILSRQSSGRFI